MGTLRKRALYDAGVLKTVETNALDHLMVEGRVTLGLLLPAENDWSRPKEYAATLPDMVTHTKHIVAADRAGFRAAWFRDMPTFDPDHGDPGQIYDPWTYLAYIAALTDQLILGTAAIVTPLEHDLHLAKRAASIDHLANGRFVFGLATGEREAEYGLFGIPYEKRGEQLRQTLRRLRGLWSKDVERQFRETAQEFGLRGFALAPKPAQRHLPAIVVGYAQQKIDWIARHSDGWFIYHDSLTQLKDICAAWSSQLMANDSVRKPLIMPLRLILEANPNAPFQSFPMGARTGIVGLKRYLEKLADLGIAHVAFSLRLSERPIMKVLEEIASDKDLIF